MVEEHVLWRGGDGLKRLMDAVRWPFERAAWALERAVIWPLEERTGDWSGGLRTLGVLTAALAAATLGVFGLVWASNSGGGSATRATAPTPAPTVARQPLRATEPATPVLQGAAPDFTPEADGGVAKAQAATGNGAPTHTTSSSASPSSSAAASSERELGPEALKVARQFAGAFVLYETGAENEKVRTAFAKTATPRLAHELLRRPPRLPANVKVPRAKVLNIVPGPRHGDTYSLSISLLRVGVTSELRIEMQYDKKQEVWQVMDALG